MADNYRFYEVNGKRYKISEAESSEFEKDFPSAKVNMSANGKKYLIGVGERDEFVKDFGENAAYASFDEEPKDNTQMPEENKEKTDDGKVHWWESLVKPVGSAVVGTAQGFVDAFQALSPKLQEMAVSRIQPYGVESIQTADMLPSYDEQRQDPNNPLTRASDKLSGIAERLSEEGDPEPDKGFIDLILEGKIGKALQKGLATAGESSITTLSARHPILASVNMISIAGREFSRLSKEDPSVPVEKRAAMAIGSAAWEQTVEKLADPFKYLGGGDVATEITEEMAKEALEKATKESTENIAKRIFNKIKGIGKNVAKDAGGEGLEEIISSAGSDVLGQTLDWIDGNSDYGFTAQWEELKKQNPDADLWDFSLAKAKEYGDAFIGGALSGGYMAGGTQAVVETAKAVDTAKAKAKVDESYNLGTQMDYVNLYDSDDLVREASTRVAESFVNEDGEQTISNEFIESLSYDEAFALSRNEEFSGRQRAELEALANAKAVQEGLSVKLDERLDNQIAEARNNVMKASENDSITIGMVNGRTVYVKGGIVNNGYVNIDEQGMNGPVIIVDAQTGEETWVDSYEINSAYTRDVLSHVEDIEKMFSENEAVNRETARNTMGPIAKLKAVHQIAGRKVQIDLGEGIIEVEIQNVSPKTGDVEIKGKKGDLGGQSIIMMPAHQFYDTIVRDDEGNPRFADNVQQGEQNGEPIARDDYRDFVGNILINGVPTEVEVMSQDDSSDSVVYEYIDENGVRRRGSSTIGEFGASIQSAEEYQPAPEPEPMPEPESIAPEPVETQEDVPADSESINWDELFERDPWNYLVELKKQLGDEALDFLNNEIAVAEDELAALDKNKGKSMNDRMDNLRKKAELKIRIGILNELVNSFNPAPVAEPVVDEPAIPDEPPTVAESNPEPEPTPEPEPETAPTPEPEPAPQPEPAPEPEPVEENKQVAPNPVADPIKEAQKRESELLYQLGRAGLSNATKQDLARRAGKAIADMFATREEYEAYEEIANDLGDYLSFFEGGVEESFAKRANNDAGSPENSVPLTEEPNEADNGEAGQDSEGRPSDDNSGGSTDEGDSQGDSGDTKTKPKRKSKGKGSKTVKQAEKYPARKGNATQKLLIDTFGFESVDIPNSRKSTLNSVYDFMMEMSKMLGISPKSIGQGGWLSVSSLRSNSHFAAVHEMSSYKISGKIVNVSLKFKYSALTGIAHEWFHALDYALEYFDTGIRRDTASEIDRSQFSGRPEVWDAVSEIVKAISESGHQERIKSLTSPSKWSYWLSPKEMCARAFDAYINNKFKEAGIEVEGVINDIETGNPTPEEMVNVIPAFDNLFRILQEKEGKVPGTSVLYQIGEQMEPQSDAKRFATESILTALDDGNRDVEILSDEQTEEYLKMIGADTETQFSIDTDKPIFISNAARAVAGIKQEKATPEQWLKMIEKAGGLKAGEDKWMGLSDWLKASDKKTLTKQEVLDYINDNTIQIEEEQYSESAEDNATIVYGQMRDILQEEFNHYRAEYYEEHEDDDFYGNPAADYAIEKLRNYFGDTQFPYDIEVDNSGDVYFTFYHEDDADMEKWAKKLGVKYEPQNPINSTRQMYTSDGLENKKEIALIVPTIKSWGEWDDVHFGDAGKGRAVAWVRFGDTEIVEDTAESDAILEEISSFTKGVIEKYGKKRSAWPESIQDEYNRLQEKHEKALKITRVLVIDEIQSKRHQEGRDKGYSMSIEEYEQRLNALETERAERLKRRTTLLRQLTEKYGDDFNSYLKLQDTAYVPNENVMTPEEVQEWYATTQDEIDSAIYNLKKEMRTGIPAAPFEKNWPELAMKRMLRYAAENGYDAVAWTKGEQQADRYDLGNRISAIHYRQFADEMRIAIIIPNVGTERFGVDKNGVVVSSDSQFVTKGMNISEIFGKEIANKIINNEGEADEHGGKRISGDGLRIGAEGMKGFYDKMLPAFMDKYGKKWGVKVSDIELPMVESGEGYSFHSVPVNDAMRESVMEGQPMFYKTPNGIVYGWTDGKKIYLTKAGLNPNTPIHEYTHLWAKAMMLRNPKGWENIKKLLKGTPVWNEVMNDVNYSNIHNDEDLVASEALSRISGTENAAKMEQMAQKMIDEAKGTGRKLEARGLIQNMRDALNKFWEFVWKELFKMTYFRNVEHVTDRVLFDLLNNTDLGALSDGQIEAQIAEENISNMSRGGENNGKFASQLEQKRINEQQELEYSDEFRRVQEESARMSEQMVSEYHSRQRGDSESIRQRLGGIFQRELERRNQRRNDKQLSVVNESKGTSFDIIQNVDGRMFHDIFSIVRNYLPNGELVDLHDNYDDAICYITSDGLAGFAVTSDGNLISVYSIYGNSKRGFLGAIKNLVTEAGATHLDGYNSSKQRLAEIYSKAFGWKVASMMDYNMEYDHDNIAENHGMPQVAFMVNTDADIETRHFNEDQYDEAEAYQKEQVEINAKIEAQNAAVNFLAGEARNSAIEHAVNSEASKLGVNVTYKTRSEMPKGHQNDKGYYNINTGEIVICTENASSIADAIHTILHEAVAHKGLRQLMGDKFNEFINRVYESLDAETKAKFDALAESKYNGNTAVAMEEYMASLAETTDFANNSVWDKIKSIFENIINAILGRNDIKIGDNELRYILRASYNNMVNPRNMETIRGWAQDQMMREDYNINHATPELLSRTGVDPTDVATMTAAEVYNRAVKDGWQEFQRQFQDAMQPVRIAIDSIQQETGNIPIEDYENYILLQNQSSSRSRVEIDDFQRRYYSPIIEHVNYMIDEIMKSRGWNLKDKKRRAEVYAEVRQYLIAKHGLERNKYYQRTKKRLLNAAERKEARADAKSIYNDELTLIARNYKGEERKRREAQAKEEYQGRLEEIKTRTTADIRDYSGLTSLFGYEPQDFEFAEQDAENFVMRFEVLFGRTDEYDSFGNLVVNQGRDINVLWNRINAATDKTLRHSYESGLLSRQQYTDISNMFEFYIPLRGFDETTAEDVYSYARFEGNRFNPAVQTAEGRTSLADDPLAIIMNMAESEIAQGNKNRAKQALYNFILNRPVTDSVGNQTQNSLMQIESVWYVQNVDASGYVTYVMAAPNREIGETYEEFENRMNALAEEDGAEEGTRKAFKSKKGKVDVGMRFQKPANANAHYIYLKVNGVEKAIYVNGDPKAADAINGVNKKPANELEQKMREANRLISSTFTNYSLEFTARNYFRDMIYSHINIGVRESDSDYRKRFRQNWRHNNLRSMIKMLTAYRNGDFDGRALTPDEVAFVEFMDNGGQTGYTLINSVENHKKDLERAIKNMQKGLEKGGVKDSTAFKYTLGAIELLNEASELVTRFAAFKTSRDMGRSVVESISDAKEVTVNFNTKGAQDGNGWMGSLAKYFGWSKYFFNASVQGVQNIKAMAEANKLKFCTTVGGVMASGLIVPILTSVIADMLGGDEEEYWNIPEYDRQNNLCIVVGGGRYVKIPLPIGFREIYALGDMVAAMAFDQKFQRDTWQIGTDMANKIASIVLPINPLESSVNGLSIWHTVGYTLAPSSAQFIIQNLSNVDWKGAPLQKEYTYNEDDPKWMKAFASNPDWMVGLSKWCNEHIGAGDMKGWDWSPEKLDNTLSNLFGGIYTVVKKTGKTMSMIWNEENRNLSNIPLTGVILGSNIDNDDRFVQDAYYDMKDYYDERIGWIKRRAEKFGYELDNIMIKMDGGYQPKIAEIYDNKNFEWMQAWYIGNKELEAKKKAIKDYEKELALYDEPSQGQIEHKTNLEDQFLEYRREFVDEMLKMN